MFVMVPVSASVSHAQQPWYHDAPPRMRAFFVAARKADRIQDPLQRCLAYPDFPGNHWPKDLARFYCRYLFGPHITMADIRDAVRTGHYRALDSRYAADLAKHFSITHFEEVIHSDFSAIHNIGSAQRLRELNRLTQVWLKADPHSAYALAVRAEYMRTMAWKIRGGNWNIAEPAGAEVAALEDAYVAIDFTLLLQGIRPPLLSIYSDFRSLIRMATQARQPRTAFDYANAGIKLDRRALEIEPKLLPAYVTIVNLGRMTGQVQVAKWAFNAGSGVDPACKVLTGAVMVNRSPRWGGSHRAMVKLKKQLEAEAVRRPFLERTIIMPRVDKADELRMHEAYDKAYATIQPALLRTPDAHSFQLAARILAGVKPSKPLKQFEYLLEASRFNPAGDAWVSYTRALFMLKLAKDPQWALPSMKIAVRAEPNDPKGHFFLGLAYLDLDAYAKAKKEFTFVAGIDNSLKYPAIMNLAIIAMERGYPAKAQSYLDEFLDKHPDDVHGWDLRGMAFMQSNDLEAAKTAFTTALDKAAKQGRHDIFVNKAQRLLRKVNRMIIDVH
ncbi:MAG TPA: DUF4034 domain-containing protein [Rhodanobacteraceae bacterium]|nr:DUF4034 domain-containing protein [Rhodanobacteraceae bacterium]